MSKIDYDLKQIKGVVFDVDGVLSPSTMSLMSDGTPSRMVNVKDSYALQLAIKMGYKIAIITGSDCMAVKKQFNGLGIDDVFMKTSTKITCLKNWVEAKGLMVNEVAFVGDDIPDYECMNYAGEMSRVKIQLRTGRTHQIRVQFSSRNMPLVGERKYATLEDPCEIALWSHKIAFTHPRTGEKVTFSQEPPKVYPWTEV